MSDKKFSLILWHLTVSLTDKIMQAKNVNFQQATQMLLQSKTYAMLENKENALWQFGATFLYKVFDNELITNEFEMPDVIL
jgi:hypothetical protein